MIQVRDIKDIGNYIDSLLIRNESDDLEYKSAAGGFPGSFWDTYSAFANTEGGTIILGVSEKSNGIYLDSLTEEQIEKYRKDFWNNVNNRSTISCNLMKTEDLQVTEYKGHRLMLFFIPRAQREQRPVFRSTTPYGGTFKRNHEGDYKCTEREVQRMFADANISHPSDCRILRNYSMDDIDIPSLRQYRQLFSLAKPTHPWLALNDQELLKKLGGYRKDRESGEEGLTVAGLLMFGKSEAITDSECCPFFFPDYQEKLEPELRWTNRIYPDGTWEANLFQFYRHVLPRLQSVLPKPFMLKDNIRREETPAHIAVREALINCCIHADYTENASLLIQLHKDKMVFSNPGTMLVSKNQYYQGGESVCRNKSLQTMFMLLGSAEKAGSGVDKILSGWKESNWRIPILEIKCRPDKCVLTMKMETVMDDATEQQLTDLFGKHILGVDHNTMIVLNTACADRSVTNESLRHVLNMHKAEISDLLRKMCKEKLLVRKGYGRGTTYHLPKKVATSDTKDCNLKNERLQPQEQKVATSDTKDCNLRYERLQPQEQKVATSDSDILKKRLPREELHNVICNICNEWKTLDEIAGSIHRSRNYIRNRILSEMLEGELIVMMYPGIPNHPKQKYKVKNNTAR
ncbi:MAG: putative DNA binding domain-containing protein [Bacteroidales bacterium]|nr:putative DNA binding domain-containing protein [Bacteroidales bacterium]MCM1146659.1 putative DNA binding domain-containing protein [Bacteroidales bacterium]MCM1206050.1 putative DNA binding domain-containing protein [Bacillota bacterium]MCM1511049.1 putative DNA binding domain-containing protein [Clostridium sp.]